MGQLPASSSGPGGMAFWSTRGRAPTLEALEVADCSVWGGREPFKVMGLEASRTLGRRPIGLRSLLGPSTAPGCLPC